MVSSSPVHKGGFFPEFFPDISISLQPSPIPKVPITTCAEPHTITTTAARVLDLFNCKHNDGSLFSSPEPSRSFCAEFFPDLSVSVQPSTDAQICSTTFTKAPSTSIFAMVTTASKKNALASNRDAKRRMEKCQLQTNGSHLEEYYVDLTDLPAPKKRRELHQLSGNSSEKFWLEDLGLYPADRLCLTNGKWITDNIINACQRLMRNAYPHIRGLEDTSLGETLAFTIQRGEFVQVLNVSGCHWITISTIGCQQGVVNVYDSIPSCSVPLRTKEQIAAIICTQAKKIILEFPAVQSQRGSSDCGLFALAFATSLCLGQNPLHTTTFNIRCAVISLIVSHKD
jgi:hypothetical protein